MLHHRLRNLQRRRAAGIISMSDIEFTESLRQNASMHTFTMAVDSHPFAPLTPTSETSTYSPSETSTAPTSPGIASQSEQKTIQDDILPLDNYTIIDYCNGKPSVTWEDPLLVTSAISFYVNMLFEETSPSPKLRLLEKGEYTHMATGFETNRDGPCNEDMAIAPASAVELDFGTQAGTPVICLPKATPVLSFTPSTTPTCTSMDPTQSPSLAPLSPPVSSSSGESTTPASLVPFAESMQQATLIHGHKIPENSISNHVDYKIDLGDENMLVATSAADLDVGSVFDENTRPVVRLPKIHQAATYHEVSPTVLAEASLNHWAAIEPTSSLAHEFGVPDTPVAVCLPTLKPRVRIPRVGISSPYQPSIELGVPESGYLSSPPDVTSRPVLDWNDFEDDRGCSLQQGKPIINLPKKVGSVVSMSHLEPDGIAAVSEADPVSVPVFDGSSKGPFATVDPVHTTSRGSFPGDELHRDHKIVVSLRKRELLLRAKPYRGINDSKYAPRGVSRRHPRTQSRRQTNDQAPSPPVVRSWPQLYIEDEFCGQPKVRLPPMSLSTSSYNLASESRDNDAAASAAAAEESLELKIVLHLKPTFRLPAPEIIFIASQNPHRTDTPSSSHAETVVEQQRDADNSLNEGPEDSVCIVTSESYQSTFGPVPASLPSANGDKTNGPNIHIASTDPAVDAHVVSDTELPYDSHEKLHTSGSSLSHTSLPPSQIDPCDEIQEENLESASAGLWKTNGHDINFLDALKQRRQTALIRHAHKEPPKVSTPYSSTPEGVAEAAFYLLEARAQGAFYHVVGSTIRARLPSLNFSLGDNKPWRKLTLTKEACPAFEEELPSYMLAALRARLMPPGQEPTQEQNDEEEEEYAEEGDTEEEYMEQECTEDETYDEEDELEEDEALDENNVVYDEEAYTEEENKFHEERTWLDAFKHRTGDMKLWDPVDYFHWRQGHTSSATKSTTRNGSSLRYVTNSENILQEGSGLGAEISEYQPGLMALSFKCADEINTPDCSDVGADTTLVSVAIEGEHAVTPEQQSEPLILHEEHSEPKSSPKEHPFALLLRRKLARSIHNALYGSIPTRNWSLKVDQPISAPCMDMILYSALDRTSRNIVLQAYEVLGATPHTTARAIRQAFLKAALNCHPDKNLGDSEKACFKSVELKKALNQCTGATRLTEQKLLEWRPSTLSNCAELQSAAPDLKAPDFIIVEMTPVPAVARGALDISACPKFIIALACDRGDVLGEVSEPSEPSTQPLDANRPDTPWGGFILLLTCAFFYQFLL